MAKLTFLPEEFTVEGKRGDTLLDVALDNGISLPHECGGNCACTTCHVRIEKGAEELSPMEEVELDRLCFAEAFSPLSRLGCQAILIGDGELIISVLDS